MNLKGFEFELIQTKELDFILELRNQEEVRNASFNKGIITFDDHENWFKEKKTSNFFHHYALKDKDQIIGVGYGENFIQSDFSCLWGFYINKNYKSSIKVGSLLKYLLLDQLFSLKEIKIIRCEVMEGFEWIKDWHIRWGHEVKNFNDEKNCYELFLLKDKWENIKDDMWSNI